MNSKKIKPRPAAVLGAPILLLTLTACSKRLPEIVLDIGGGSLTVEVADTPESRRTGLMNRSFLGENRGMLFVFEKESRVSFWMKNTRIPLSIAFIAADGTIRQIEDMEPLSPASVQSRRNVPYALEVNRGWFESRGIAEGDKIILPPNLR